MLASTKIPLIAGLVTILFLSGCVSPPQEAGELDGFAQCLTDNGVKMYGSITCSHCAREKELFGTSFQYIDDIECHPQGETPQTQLCLDKNIEGTPTWTREGNGREIARIKGYRTIEELSEFSGCPVPEGYHG